MKVTPLHRFGKYRPGDEFELPDKAARVYIKAKRVREVTGYQTRMLTAGPAASPVQSTAALTPDSATADTASDASEAPEATVEAPYGYTLAGTPRKRPAPST